MMKSVLKIFVTTFSKGKGSKDEYSCFMGVSLLGVLVKVHGRCL